MAQKRKAPIGLDAGSGRESSLGEANTSNPTSATASRKARRAWMAALRKHGKPGRFLHIHHLHDDWCALFSSGCTICTCNPDRILKDEKGRELARVEGAGSYDPLELIEGAGS